jgi:hypothetical protein
LDRKEGVSVELFRQIKRREERRGGMQLCEEGK